MFLSCVCSALLKCFMSGQVFWSHSNSVRSVLLSLFSSWANQGLEKENGVMNAHVLSFQHSQYCILRQSQTQVQLEWLIGRAPWSHLPNFLQQNFLQKSSTAPSHNQDVSIDTVKNRRYSRCTCLLFSFPPPNPPSLVLATCNLLLWLKWYNE